MIIVYSDLKKRIFFINTIPILRKLHIISHHLHFQQNSFRHYMLLIMFLIRSTLQLAQNCTHTKEMDTTYGPLVHMKTSLGISTPILFLQVCRPLIELLLYVHSVSS